MMHINACGLLHSTYAADGDSGLVQAGGANCEEDDNVPIAVVTLGGRGKRRSRQYSSVCKRKVRTKLRRS